MKIFRYSDDRLEELADRRNLTTLAGAREVYVNRLGKVEIFVAVTGWRWAPLWIGRGRTVLIADVYKDQVCTTSELLDSNLLECFD